MEPEEVVGVLAHMLLMGRIGEEDVDIVRSSMVKLLVF